MYAPEKRQVQPFRRRFHSAFTERVRNLAAVRAGIAGHVFDQPYYRHAGLVEQLARPRRVDQSEVLRRRDEDGAHGLVALEHGELDVAGAGGQIDQQRIDIAPMGIDQLRERIACHRPAPCKRAARLHEMTHGQHRNAEGTFDRDELLVARDGFFALIPKDHRLRRAVDIGIDEPDSPARFLQRDGEIGGQGRLADTALAAADGDQAALLALRSHDDADVGNVVIL